MSGNKSQKLVVGVTGIPGSGKTAFVRFLVENGADLVDVDAAGRWAIEENDYVKEQIRKTFGDEFFENGNFLRKKLGAIVFADENARNKLNSIVHPVMLARIGELIDEFQNQTTDSLIVVDAALLFELDIDKKCNKTITVWADVEKCIQRSMDRDKISWEQAIQRIQSQLPQEEKKQRVDYVVENNSSSSVLKKRANELFEKLSSQANE